VIEFPFFCPACKQVANAKADPVGLLFGGAVDFQVQCTECSATFKCAITREHEVTVKERLPDASE